MFDRIAAFIRSLYGTEGQIPLHAPRFAGKEKEYLARCIDTTFVSYVGEYVSRFEEMTCAFTGAKFAVATANGTLALHAALMLAGVRPGDEVITQALTFVGTANAIAHCGARPVFVDSDRDTLGMSPESLRAFIADHTRQDDAGRCTNRMTGRRIAACVPMHVFGHPLRIDRIVEISRQHDIPVVEDAAESLGSHFAARHTGHFGVLGILSYNGNKIVTTGGGGMIITDDEELARRAKHITTTAKVPHAWEFFHDEVGYNYRMSNVTGAIGCAQMEQLPLFIERKRCVADAYRSYFRDIGVAFVDEPPHCRSNFWLNAIILEEKGSRDQFLAHMNTQGIQCRPVWRLMHELPMYADCESDELANARWLADRLVTIPSSVPQ